MRSFTIHTGRAAPLRRSNVDTDQIIPARFLKRVTRTGFADGLFAAWRDDPQFVLNRAEHANASILVAGSEFGTGSSREHAVWALRDYGFHAVLAPGFGDIFRGNALKGGLLPVELNAARVEWLWDALEADPSMELTVDLQEREVRVPQHTWAFDLDAHSRWRLLEGLDDVDLTLRDEEAVSAFEAGRPHWLPRTLPAA